MILVLDEYCETYVWVDNADHDVELSPHFDYKQDALDWKQRILQEVTK